MDPIFRFPASPGTPLFPISPERANRQPYLPNSPSLPAGLAALQNDPFTSNHSRGSSDVQSKVAQFNTLSKEAAQRRKDNEASLRRAVLGREEAESESRRLRDENKVLRREIEEGRARERRVGERVEGVMEELQQAKETHAHSHALYEKEVRRARKEAFKSSSALVKLQEELKSARNKYTLMREEVEVQRRKVNSKEQETFAAQYQLVGLQEELDTLRQQMRITVEEKETLKISLKEEEVARIAAEGKIAFPVIGDGDEFASPKKKWVERRESLKENKDPDVEEDEELMAVQRALDVEMQLRRIAEDQIDFMKMECQFRCCSCRIAEKHGGEYIHDNGPAAQFVRKASQNPDISKRYSPTTNPDPFVAEPNTTKITTASDPHTEPITIRPQHPLLQPQDSTENLISFSPTTGTFFTLPPATEPTTPEELSPIRPHHFPVRPLPPTPLKTSTRQPSPPSRSPSLTPHKTPLLIPSTPPKTIHTTTTFTTTIPLAPSTPSDAMMAPIIAPPYTPNATLTREQALEQIRQRRGRARSIAAGFGTPRRPVTAVERRDVSAPVGGSVRRGREREREM